jgi:hypothetical protein
LDLHAQERPALSVEAAAGLGTGGGGEYSSGAGFVLDAAVALRARLTRRGAVLVGFAVGAQGPPGGGDDCILAPSGRCVPDFPLFYSTAAFLGWEIAGYQGPSVRALAGPAYYRADEGGAALGLQGRVDVATPALLHVALVASVRGTVLPNYRGDALGLVAAVVGVRLQ